MVSCRYRNRRIGEFLKELEFSEGRGTGLPKMRRSLKNNGSSEPHFFTDNERLSFWTEIKIHPEFLTPVKTAVTAHDGVYDPTNISLSKTELRILNIIENQTVSISQMLLAFGYTVVTRNIRTALHKLLEKKLVTYTIPSKPRSKYQQYKMTAQGKSVLKNRIG